MPIGVGVAGRTTRSFPGAPLTWTGVATGLMARVAASEKVTALPRSLAVSAWQNTIWFTSGFVWAYTVWRSHAPAAVFVAVHLLRHSPLAAALEGISSAALYERLRHELSRPFFVGLYVVGLGSLCLHAFQGFTACVERFGAGLRDQGRRLVVFLGLLFAIGLYVGFLDGLSHYVAGRAWIARPEAAEPEGPTPVAP